MHRLFSTLLQKYGTAIEVMHIGTFRGFLFPMRKSSNPPSYAHLGMVPAEEFEFFMEAGSQLRDGETLIVNGEFYRVVRTEPMLYQDSTLYYWGTCKPEGVTL